MLIQMNNTNLVCCRSCGQFIADKVGDGGGLGQCQAYAAMLKSDAEPLVLRDFVRELGGDPNCVVFWGGEVADRACLHYAER